MKILAVIPARYASTRFPGKPLVYIDGKTMVHRVYDQVTQCAYIDKVVVATDHYSIQEHVTSFGGHVVMTSDAHPSGTDRCYEAYTKMNQEYDFVINVQGDEPYIQPEQLNLLYETISRDSEIATLAKKIETLETLYNTNTPKVIFNQNKEAIYFSRHAIPYMQGVDGDLWLAKHKYYKHIGTYAYRTDVLKTITQLPPSSLEIAESLEQLRWLEHGLKIKVGITEHDSYGIDTPEDIVRLKFR